MSSSLRFARGKRSLACMLAALLLFSAVLFARPAESRADSGFAKVIVTANRLNLRKGPSTERGVVALLQKGVVLDVLGVSGDWLRVQLPSGDPSGYVLAEHVAVQPLGYDALGIGAATGNVRLRKGCGTSYPSLGTIPKGTPLIVIEKTTSSWVRVRRADNGKEGYVSSAYVSLVCKCQKDNSTAPSGTAAAVKGSGVNLRKGPSTDYASLGKLKDGTALTLLSQNGGWYRVYAPSLGSYGYIYRLYVRLSAIPDELAVQGTISGSGVNIRKGPSTTYQSLGKLSRNTIVTILDTSGNWCRVRVDSTGTEGYVHQKYVAGQ